MSARTPDGLRTIENHEELSAIFVVVDGKS